MFGCSLSIVQASLHGMSVSRVLSPGGTLLGSRTSPSWSSKGFVGAPQLLEPHSRESPQQGRLLKKVSASVTSSGLAESTAGMSERAIELGQLSQGFVEQTEVESDSQKALPKLRPVSTRLGSGRDARIVGAGRTVGGVAVAEQGRARRRRRIDLPHRSRLD